LGLILGLACVWASPLRADYEAEEQARHLRQADESIWQALFGQRVLAMARRELGRPYVWGGKTEATGFDCSGYTAFVLRSVGVAIAPTALGQFGQGLDIDASALQPGDLVFFTGQGSPLHVGIYAGDGNFLQAPGTGKVIESSKLSSPYFSQHFVGARRMTPALDDALRRRDAAAHPAPGRGPSLSAIPTTTPQAIP
jgi:hypothetical protein